MVTLTDRPDITMPWTYLARKLTVGKRRVSIDALSKSEDNVVSTTTVLPLCFSGSVLNGRLAAEV